MSTRTFISPALLTAAVAALVLGACGPQGGDGESTPPSATGSGQPAAVAASPETPPWPDQRAELGRETYLAACARCHEAGEDGAPRTGVPEDWSGRSDLWQAVLFRHAREGYLAMPGKGGDSGLSDQAVDAASEYILEKTFPERPRD